jgi:endonuclease/exonuclease/phosphatase family metal-dependent hydrolase
LYENSLDRVGTIAENITKADLDVICLQEATDSMCQDLQIALKGRYSIKWVKHANFSGVGILFKDDKFKLLYEKALSVTVQMEDPANPGIYQPSPNRIHLLNDLMDKTTQKVYRIVSCHMFDPQHLQNKVEQARYVINFAEKDPIDYLIDRTIIAGDMNQDQFGDVLSPPKGALPSEALAPSFQPFIENEYQVDGNYDSTLYEKNTPGNGKIHSKNRHVDWIWVKKSKPQHHPLIDFDPKGSDHRLVASVIC